MTTSHKTELLAPAGGMPVLDAALTAGADAVYLGLKHFNARNGARNFTPDELAQACAKAKKTGAKVYLTLNTDLCQRELGMAARSLAAAEKAGVDAVLVRDPAYLTLRPFFPKLDFHFSTQAGISSSAGVKASKELGLSRVVLARELTMEEIKASCAIEGIETEVFIQGALCFCCSGRCLLSSWGGGRSGNRGSCASPCRVAWTNEAGTEARPLSMRDLCLVDWVDELAKAGVASLKIEGRLKSHSWVSRAVSLYRRALDKSATVDEIHGDAGTLGDYTGRDLTDGYLKGERLGLTGESGRAAARIEGDTPQVQDGPSPVDICVTEDDRKGTVWSFTAGASSIFHRTPPQRIANARRAVSVGETIEGMKDILKAAKCRTGVVSVSDEMSALLLPKNAANQALDAMSAFARGLLKEDDGLPRGVELPAELKAILAAKVNSCPENTLTLGASPDRLRVFWQDAGAISRKARLQVLAECFPCNMADADEQADALLKLRNFTPVAALPQVIYEEQIEPIRHFIRKMRDAGITLEVNSWDTWQIAREEGATFEAGPGLAVINAMAAKKLAELGCKSVSVACEIDRLQLEDLCAAANVPLSLTVFAKPPLMTTRAILPVDFSSGTFTDSRENTVSACKEGPVTVIRPVIPMDWRSLKDHKVLVAHLVADLRNAVNEAASAPDKPFLFNFNRSLR